MNYLTIEEKAARLKDLKKIKDQNVVSYSDIARKLDFQEKGINEVGLALREPIGAAKAKGFFTNKPFKDEMFERVKNRFPTGNRRNDVSDAYRHALSGYTASIRFGERFAKDAGDIYERTNTNPTGERLMDAV